jgi:hypothetical protein
LLPNIAARGKFSLVRTTSTSTGTPPRGRLVCAAVHDGGEDANGKTTGYPPNFGSILAAPRIGRIARIYLAGADRWVTASADFGIRRRLVGQGVRSFMLSCAETGEVSIGTQAARRPTPRGEDRRGMLRELDALRRARETELANWDGVYRRYIPC